MSQHMQGPLTVRTALMLLPFLSGLAFFACHDDEGPARPPACAYSGVTVTDSAGRVLSDDVTDWCPYPRYGIGWTWSLYPAVPNPARNHATIEFGCLENGIVTLDIKDCNATTVRTFQPDSGAHTVIWDLRDMQGRRVGPGVYRCFYEVAYPNTLYTCSGDIEVLAL